MNKSSWRIFFATIRHNLLSTIFYTLLDATFVIGTIAFSMSLALYFGFDALHIGDTAIGQSLRQTPIYVLIVAACIALVVFFSRVGQAYMEAAVTVSQEMWFARRGRLQKIVNAKTISRASNHYGRLATAAMKSVGAATILLMSLVTVPFLLKWPWSIAMAGTIVMTFALLSVAFQSLAKKMQESSASLVEHARPVSIWKSDPENEGGTYIQSYENAYFWRIFISSIFSFAPLLFAIVLVAVLILLDEYKIEVRFGAAFVALGVAQAYLGLVSRLFASVTKSSAFMPSVSVHSAVLWPSEGSQNRQKMNETSGEYEAYDDDY